MSLWSISLPWTSASTFSVHKGNSHFCTVICQREGISRFPGTEGCLLSDHYPSVLEEALEVQLRADGFPVWLLWFRSVDCSPGLHRVLGDPVGSLSRDPTALVSGWLVGSCLLGAGSQLGGPVLIMAVVWLPCLYLVDSCLKTTDCLLLASSAAALSRSYIGL